MVCPNGDPSFTSRLYQWGIINTSMSNKQVALVRKDIYYQICILVRSILILLVYYFRNQKIIQILVLLASLLAIINLGLRNKGNQWWSKKFQLLMSILLFIAVILVWFKKAPSYSMALIMLISLVGGFIQSLLITFC